MFKKYQRVGVFVDVQNLFYSAKHLYDRKVDFEALLKLCVRGRALIRAFAYVVQTDELAQANFIEKLTQIGYEVKTKTVRFRADGSAKGDWDMGIAIDTISLHRKLDVIALVSGDGDFVPLVNMLKANGVKVEVFSFSRSTAEDLILAADEYFPLGEEVLMR